MGQALCPPVTSPCLSSPLLFALVLRVARSLAVIGLALKVGVELRARPGREAGTPPPSPQAPSARRVSRALSASGR